MASFSTSADLSGLSKYPDIWFDKLVADIQEKGWVVCDAVSELSGVNPHEARLEAIARRDTMNAATISSGLSNEAAKEKRSDKVAFLKLKDPALPEDAPQLHAHALWVDGLRERLEEKLEYSMETSTLMLAEYPSGGTRYVRHRDAAPSPYAGRKLTAILYLNEEPWLPEHGGELHIWPNSNQGTELDITSTGKVTPDEEPFRSAEASSSGAKEVEEAEVEGGSGGAAEAVEVVAPIMDRLVIFRSSLEHEVRPAHFHRVAFTSWFVNRKHQAFELMAEHLKMKQGRLEESQRAASAAAASRTDKNKGVATRRGNGAP
jgi:SM-20-related protein